MTILKAVIAGTLLLAGTEASAQSVTEMTVAARRILADRLVEPGSLQLRNLRAKQVNSGGASLTILCGEYNAKNRMGGYTGFTAFAYEADRYGAVVTLSMGGRNGMAIGYYAGDGSGDFDSDDDPAAVLRAGVSSERLSEVSSRAFAAAQQTVAHCLRD